MTKERIFISGSRIVLISFMVKTWFPVYVENTKALKSKDLEYTADHSKL